MSDVINISSAGNVEVPAYQVLLEKGYQVRNEYHKADKEEIWFANMGEKHFRAHSPLELLGIVAIYENRGKNWQASDGDIETFLKKFYPNT